jgi:hypothetical protein
VQRVGARGRDLETAMSGRLVALEDIIVNRGGTLAQKLATDSARFTDEMGQRLVQIETLLTTEGEQLIDRLTQRTDGAAITLAARTNEAAAAMEAQIKAFEDRSGAKSAEIANSLDSLIARIDTNLGNRAQVLNEALVERTIEIARVLAEGGRDVTQALAAKADEIGDVVTSKSEALTLTLSAKADEINQTLGGRALEIADTLDQRIGSFEERVVNRLDTVSGTLDERSRFIAETLQAKTDGISATLGARAEELRQLFDVEGQGVVSAMGSRGEAIAADVAAIGQAVVSTIESRGASIVEGLRDWGSGITTALAQSQDELRTTLESGTSSSVSTLVATNERIRSELGGTLERLGEANQLMQQIVATANTNLSGVESSLSDRIKELELILSAVSDETGRASMQVAQQVDALKGVSSGAIREATGLVGRLDEQGRSLAESTRTNIQALGEAALRLETVEARVGSALTERKQGLEELLEAISDRTGDVESITRSFTALVEDSLKAAEQRARQIGGVLADSAEATTHAITEHFETVRTNTGKERERTAAALRAAYEGVAGDLGSGLAKATEQFQQAAMDLRAMNAEIQRELEATRAELRRGVLDMPRETQETTAAMRRVVGDQIKALNELSDIVTRSGRSLDVAAPESIRARSVARAPEPAPAPVPPPRMAEVPRETAIARAPERPVPTSRPEPVRPVADAGPAPRGGWLSDLLKRASRDERPQPKPSVPALEKLDSLSVDIARMIDHDAAVELWDRYKRGERNVFTRRLYTLEGQQTFDEIRRKYRRDEEFKDTVDRYVEEFERLLDDASQGGRDQAIANDYLTSETGKVYTMLVHASSRFE